MIETFLALLTAHFLADFLFQPNWMIVNKKNPLVFCLHIIIIGVVAIALLGGFPIIVLLILCGTHLIMDGIKTYILDNKSWAFCLDQSVHVIVIVGLAVVYPETFKLGCWKEVFADKIPYFYAVLCLISGLLASLPFGGALISKLTERFSEQLKDSTNDSGLESGGKYIGQLERGLVMLLVMIGSPTAVGFIVAAKSILRFGDITQSGQRKRAEYVIIGTFMSFGWGLLIAVTTKSAILYYVPSSL